MLSIIIPFFNEHENLQPLFEEIHTALKDHSYEIIFVDDGSTDNSREVAQTIAKHNKQVVVVPFFRRQGKGYALAAGIEKAKGDQIMFMDADLQDDPADIPAFITKLEEGYDLVNGIRVKRKDLSAIKFYSKMGNSFLRKFLKSPFTDVNCGFKIFRKEILREFPFYSNNFRFLPIAAYYKGFRVSQIEVNNRSRQHGKSKFGLTKPYIGLIDTFTAYFLYQFAERPLHFFGTIGMVFFGLGFLVSFYMVFERLVYGVLLYRRPGLQFAILFLVIGIQIIMTGFIGELIVYMNKRKLKS